MLQCRSGHARTMPATLGLGDGPRAVTARTSPREPARRATAPRLRDRSGGPPPSTRQARATRNMAAKRRVRCSDASEFGDGASCVLCLQRPLPLTLTNDTFLGEIILVSFDREKKVRCACVALCCDTRGCVLLPAAAPGSCAASWSGRESGYGQEHYAFIMIT